MPSSKNQTPTFAHLTSQYSYLPSTSQSKLFSEQILSKKNVVHGVPFDNCQSLMKGHSVEMINLTKCSPFKNLFLKTLSFSDNFHMEYLVVARKGPEYSSRGTPMKDHYFPIFSFPKRFWPLWRGLVHLL